MWNLTTFAAYRVRWTLSDSSHVEEAEVIVKNLQSKGMLVANPSVVAKFSQVHAWAQCIKALFSKVVVH